MNVTPFSCHGCGKSLAKRFHQCSRCKLGFYCGKKCQLSNWSAHKEMCKPFDNPVFVENDVPLIGNKYSSRLLAGGDPPPEFDPTLDLQIMEAQDQDATRSLRMYAAIFRNPNDGNNKTVQTRLFQCMNIVYHSIYAKFLKLNESSILNRDKLLLEWALTSFAPEPEIGGPANDPIIQIMRRGITLNDIQMDRSDIRTKIIMAFQKGRGEGREDTVQGREIEYAILLASRVETLIQSIESRFREMDGINLNGYWQGGADGRWKRDPSNRRSDRFRDEWTGKIADMLDKMANLVGLGGPKKSVVEFISFYLALPTSFLERHMNIMFWGEAGTGKTEVGRILGSLFFYLGFLPSQPPDEFNVLTKSDFVAQFGGQSTHKTRMRFVQNLGSFIFFDEAYTLVAGRDDAGGKDSLGEIVNLLSIFQGMIAMIMAGQRNRFEIQTSGYLEGEGLFKWNDGLARRFPDKWIFYPYSSKSLYQIFLSKAHNRNVEVVEQKGTNAIRKAKSSLYSLIKAVHRHGGFTNSNGGGIETLVNLCIRLASKRFLVDINNYPALPPDQGALVIDSDVLEEAFGEFALEKRIMIQRDNRSYSFNIPQDPEYPERESVQLGRI